MIYNPKEFEAQCYTQWENAGNFKLDSNKHIQNGKNFSIMMPPPNITGALHMGHALTYSLQDIIVRYKRMCGFRVLYQAGIDHAGIATQNVVEKQLLKKGIKKESIGREAFLNEVWKWKEESGDMIILQLKRLGVSVDWQRARFTMDIGLQNAVKKAFVSWYNAGLIVQGDYMVNWCTHDGALSDIEVEYEENNGWLYHLRYFLDESGADSSSVIDSKLGAKSSAKYIIVATTRPETYFGDSAVMVHPQDSRYSHLIGKFVKLPIINKKIPIIADDSVDMDFGTGAVKVTPAHDNNDYEVGKRHKLEFVTIFDKNGILNEKCASFTGLERLEARDKIVEKLQDLGFIEKIEAYKNQIGKCYRCGNVVEPYISKQWFVKKDIAKNTILRVNAGELRFFPNQWINNFNAWMRDLRPWCISRQLWWGHRIPVFYCKCGEKIASQNERENCPKCGAEMSQDNDVLDTWFSSGLWAFSTLGWGNEAESNQHLAESSAQAKLYNKRDLEDFYPNSLLITSFDILFFWVARMLFSGENLLHKLPFRDVYLHALVCDEFGRKMSKSKGNVVNPLELMDTHSSDILRFSLAYNCIQGRDIKIGENSLEIGRALATKILNAFNFLQLYKTQQNGEFVPIERIESPLGKYIYYRFNICLKNIHSALENYRFNEAASEIYKFLFNDFCDWGIEFVKAQKSAVFELGGIFIEAMKALHPFMPFLSEFIFSHIENSSIMLQKYPIYNKNLSQNSDFEIIKDAVISIRRAKIAIDMANKQIRLAYIKLNQNANIEVLNIFIPKLAKCAAIEFVEQKMPNCIFDLGKYCEIYIPTEGINLDEIRTKLRARRAKIEGEINKLNAMLENPNFLKNAPQNLINSNQSALDSAKNRLAKIDIELNALEG